MCGHTKMVGRLTDLDLAMTEPTPVTEDGEVIGLPPNPPTDQPVEDTPPTAPEVQLPPPPPMVVEEDE